MKKIDLSANCITFPISDFESVREFHNVFDVQTAVDDIPVVPDDNTFVLRWRLIEEEYKEAHAEFVALYDGCYNNTKLPYTEEDKKVALAKIGKEMADLIYVLHGAGLAFGINMDDVFAEVHRSNMTKLPPDGIVLRRADGKVIKPPTYSPADVCQVLYGENHGR